MARHVRVGTPLLHWTWDLAHQSGLRVMDPTEIEGAVEGAKRKKPCGIIPPLPACLTARPLVRTHRFVIDDGHAMRFDDGEESTYARNLGPHRTATIEVRGDVAASC